MRKYKCDLCGAIKDEYIDLDNLKEDYCTEIVKEVCRSCSNLIEKREAIIEKRHADERRKLIQEYIKYLISNKE